MGLPGYPSQFHRRTKQRFRLALGIVIAVSFIYYVVFPYFVERFAYPLFCDESSPCQNHSVSLYSHRLATNRVVSCQFSSSNGYAIAVVVLCQEKEFERRKSIRNSWGKRRIYRKTEVATFFLVAREKHDLQKSSDIMKEAEEHDDLIFADMADSYMNLTLKVLHGLTWATRHCSNFNFVVKVDSDVFFNPFSLVDYFYLHNLLVDPNVEFLGGSLCSMCRPRRAFNDQWAISVFVYPHPFYPDYTHGPCYVISRVTATKLVLSYPYVRMIPYEDVFFTGIVAGMYMKTPRTSMEGMMGYSGRMEYDRERYATHLIASHQHDEREVARWWNDVIEFRKTHNIVD